MAKGRPPLSQPIYSRNHLTNPFGKVLRSFPSDLSHRPTDIARARRRRPKIQKQSPAWPSFSNSLFGSSRTYSHAAPKHGHHETPRYNPQRSALHSVVWQPKDDQRRVFEWKNVNR